MKLKQLLLPLVAGTLMSVQTMAQKPKSFEKAEVDTTVAQMVEYFRGIFAEKGYLKNEAVKDSLASWEKINAKVHWTRDERGDIDYHLEDIDQNTGDTTKRADEVLKMVDHKIHTQMEEEKENDHPKLSPKEIVKILKEEGFLDDIATIEDVYIGNSDYITLILPELHGSKGKKLSTKVKKRLDFIYEVETRLLSKGIKIAFGREGFWDREMDDGTVLSASVDTLSGELYEKNTALRRAKNSPSYGLEKKEVRAPADTARWHFSNALRCNKNSNFLEKEFPMLKRDYVKKQWNNLRGRRDRMGYKLALSAFLGAKTEILFEDHKSVFDHFRDKFNTFAINGRNISWASEEIPTIAENTRCDAVLVSVGENHTRDKDPSAYYYEDLTPEEFDDVHISLQEALQKEAITHLVIRQK